uniref:SKP1 component POZ domain-containing protein n=1 Tax=Triticum urartu TaxID=4572 RepID=A0A8R7VIF3_TRIUA
MRQRRHRRRLTLRSSDGVEFVVEETVAMELQTIKHMVEDYCIDNITPSPTSKPRSSPWSSSTASSTSRSAKPKPQTPSPRPPSRTSRPLTRSSSTSNITSSSTSSWLQTTWTSRGCLI